MAVDGYALCRQQVDQLACSDEVEPAMIFEAELPSSFVDQQQRQQQPAVVRLVDIEE